MGLYDLSLGTILIASWVNFFLVAFEIQQLARYFKRYPNDGFWTRLPVILAIPADIITTLAICALVYSYSITHFGDLAFARSTPWTQIPYLVGTGCSAVVCQSFLAVRVYRISRHPWWLIAFAPCIAAGFAGSIGMAIFLSIYTTLDVRYKVTIMVTLWTVSSAATDIVISAVFVYSLRRVKSEFHSTDGLIRKLAAQAVASGAFSAIVASLVFITFRVAPTTNLGPMFGFILGRVYTLTMLYNLNSRASVLDNPTSFSPPNSRDLMDCIRLGGVGITNTLTAQVINEGVHIRNPDERDESREADDGAAGRPSFAQPRLPSRKPSQPDEISLENWEVEQDNSRADLVVRYRV